MQPQPAPPSSTDTVMSTPLSFASWLLPRGATPATTSETGDEEAVWNGARLAAKVDTQQYADVMRVLDMHMDKACDPRASNWCIVHGYCASHVPVLYKLSRNLLKWRGGRVPTCEDLEFGFRCALLLLLRVAQDVEACRLDLAKGDREDVFPAFRDKVRGWAQQWLSAAPVAGAGGGAAAGGGTEAEVEALQADDGVALPRVVDVLRGVQQWLEQAHATGMQLPLPTWATSFHVTWLRSLGCATFQWTAPAQRDVVAFQRCLTVTTTRDSVARSFVSFVATCTTWEQVLSAGMADFIAVHDHTA